MVESDKQPWQAYWRQTANDTFDNKFDDSNVIALAVAKAYRSTALRNDIPTGVLDLGCGKGEHFGWLRSLIAPADSTNFSLLGVDFASGSQVIDNRTLIIEDDFRSLANVKTTGHSINNVFALFAAEYADLTKVIIALKCGVLPGADVVFVMHTESSEISKKSTYTQEFYSLLLTESLELAMDSLKRRNDVKHFEQFCLSQLGAIINMRKQYLEYDIHLVGHQLKNLFTSIYQSNADSQALRDYINALQQHEKRLEQQLQAAKNTTNLDTVLAEAGISLKYDEILSCEYGEIGRFVHFILL